MQQGANPLSTQPNPTPAVKFTLLYLQQHPQAAAAAATADPTVAAAAAAAPAVLPLLLTAGQSQH
jgi:hypothetical protein